MPRNENDMKRLLEKANSLPMRPGVYIMRGVSGGVIYVGKAKKLKNRVTQYFRNSQKDIKTANMVAAVADFEYYVCDTEMEALTLENTFIKQYTPKYNIRLKDAKKYPYIKITNDEYPRLVMTRNRDDDKAKYFGPYSGTSTVFSIINMLSAALGLPTCKLSFPRDIGKRRPCIYYQMGRCSGICTGNVTLEEHNAKIKLAADILKGNTSAVKNEMTEKMLSYAEEEKYELAAKCRDIIISLDKLTEKQKVVASPDVEHDVIGLFADDLTSAVSVFYIRDGKLTDRSEYVFGQDRILDGENISSFICEHYKIREYIPREILLSFEMDDEELVLVSEYLTSIAGRRVTLRTPERGALKTLCDMVRDNAEEKAKAYKMQNEKDEGVLVRLAELLRLEVYPERIEAYDISNLGSEHITAGMIVSENAKFKKQDYRFFNIKSVSDTPDDYASMCEAISRRVAHLSDGEGSYANYPDLILLDGGRGHVAAVRSMLADMGIDIPVFGMVKDDYHKTRALCTDSEEISIARENAVFTFIYNIQEEVHRFTISKMQNAKRKTVKKSSLTKIHGIGDAKAKALLSHFGGLAAVKAASFDELVSVKGVSSSDAQNIIDYFKGKN